MLWKVNYLLRELFERICYSVTRRLSFSREKSIATVNDAFNFSWNVQTWKEIHKKWIYSMPCRRLWALFLHREYVDRLHLLPYVAVVIVTPTDYWHPGHPFFNGSVFQLIAKLFIYLSANNSDSSVLDVLVWMILLLLFWHRASRYLAVIQCDFFPVGVDGFSLSPPPPNANKAAKTEWMHHYCCDKHCQKHYIERTLAKTFRQNM